MLDAAAATQTMGQHQGGSNAIDLTGSDGTGTDPLDVMAFMAKLLDEQSVPEEGRWFVAPPSFYNELSQSGSKLLSVDFNAGQGSIRNGLVSSGKLRGFDMYKSNNVPATSTCTGQVFLPVTFLLLQLLKLSSQLRFLETQIHLVILLEDCMYTEQRSLDQKL